MKDRETSPIWRIDKIERWADRYSHRAHRFVDDPFHPVLAATSPSTCASWRMPVTSTPPKNSLSQKPAHGWRRHPRASKPSPSTSATSKAPSICPLNSRDTQNGLKCFVSIARLRVQHRVALRLSLHPDHWSGDHAGTSGVRGRGSGLDSDSLTEQTEAVGRRVRLLACRFRCPGLLIPSGMSVIPAA